jgi:hypothetical protein
MLIFSQQLLMAEIWYFATIFILVRNIVGSVFGPVRFLFADLVGYYTHFSSHNSKQLLMTGIWYLVTSFIYVCHIVGSVFGPVRFLLPVCRLSWFLCTFFSSSIDGRNLIFGHKLHIGTRYRGKRFWTRHIPISCLPTWLVFIHIEHICGGIISEH